MAGGWGWGFTCKLNLRHWPRFVSGEFGPVWGGGKGVRWAWLATTGVADGRLESGSTGHGGRGGWGGLSALGSLWGRLPGHWPWRRGGELL